MPRYLTRGVGRISNSARTGSFIGTGDKVPPVDEWVHVAATFDGTTAIIYFNGIKVGSGAFSFGSKTDSRLLIGAAGQNEDQYNGTIDEVTIYNYAMSKEDMAQLYTDIIGGTVCMEFHQYDFDHNCYVDLSDLAVFLSGWMECNIVPICIN